MKIYNKNRIMVEPFTAVIIAAFFAITYVAGSTYCNKTIPSEYAQYGYKACVAKTEQIKQDNKI